jgi:hypothetical protein
MASSGERRLVFDTGGKRKHVVRVVYAILALLMGGSLFLVIGPVNIGELIGNSSGTSSATKVLDEQAEGIEKRLAKDPNNAQLLLALTRARLNAGNSQIEVVSETEAPIISLEAHEDFDIASQAWSRYLKQAGDEPNATVAQLLGGTYIRLAEGSTTVAEAVESVAKATKAQLIAAAERPSLNSLSTLAIYQYYNGEYAAGDRSTKQAAAKAISKAEAKGVEKQLAEYRKQSKAFEAQKKEIAKAESELSKEGGAPQNPFGGLGAAGSGSLGE